MRTTFLGWRLYCLAVAVRNVVISLGCILTALAAPAPVAAGTLSWNMCEGGSDNRCSPQNGAADSVGESPRGDTDADVNRVFDFNSIEPTNDVVFVRAFRTATKLGGGSVSATDMTVRDGGVGAGPEDSAEHGVDNIGYDEFLVFQLPSDNSRPLSFKIGWREGDADIATWIGGTLGGLDDALDLFLAGTLSWAAAPTNPLAENGYTQHIFIDVAANTSQFFRWNATGRYLIIGARNEVDIVDGANVDGGDDKFRVMQIVASVSLPAALEVKKIPEPGTLSLYGIAAAGLHWVRRRPRAPRPRAA
jgi:hypothetical protein